MTVETAMPYDEALARFEPAAVGELERLTAQVQIDDAERLQVVGGFDDERLADQRRRLRRIVGLAFVEGLAQHRLHDDLALHARVLRDQARRRAARGARGARQATG